MNRLALASLLIPLAASASPWPWESIPKEAEDFVQRESAWATSTRCQTCHQDHYATWHRTYHRTMTQEASATSVAGRFDGRPVTQWGVSVRPTIRRGRYYFEYLDALGNTTRSYEVKRTVGSHRYQQYLTQLPEAGNNYFRLHLLWHIGEQRWVHLNAAFLGPDEQAFDEPVATWNHNCIFCHNTGPQPNITNQGELSEAVRRGEAVDVESEARYDSRVAELGIACEACHGPGDEHAARNRNPFRRYFLHLTGEDDPTIVNPGKLDHRASTQICGQCHGQRVPRTERINEWITTGPSYRPGESLHDHVNVVWSDSVPPRGASQELFKLRFWGDGTPRLSAYELQGTLQSACFQDGEAGCISCHTAHGGDPEGMLPRLEDGNELCTQCHQSLARDVSAHTRHEPGGPGSSCVACHMPKIVYGVMAIHRSHRIEIPSPASDAASGRPNVCTACHLDRTVRWAAETLTALWGIEEGLPAARRDGAPLEVIDAVAQLWAGDPVQRGVLAYLAGRRDSPLEAPERAFLVPHLLGLLSHNYPSARRFARDSLVTLEQDLREAGLELEFGTDLTEFDYTGSLDQRTPFIDRLWQQWLALPKSELPPPPPGSLLGADYLPLDAPLRALMRLGEQNTRQVHIGE